MKIRPYVAVLSEGRWGSLVPIASVQMPCFELATLASWLLWLWACLTAQRSFYVSVTPELDVGSAVRGAGWRVIVMAGTTITVVVFWLAFWGWLVRGVSS